MKSTSSSKIVSWLLRNQNARLAVSFSGTRGRARRSESVLKVSEPYPTYSQVRGAYEEISNGIRRDNQFPTTFSKQFTNIG